MPGINGIFEPFNKYVKDQLEKRQNVVKERKEGEFYTYTTNKTCYLRMVSGVNIATKNNILEESEKTKRLNEGLAKQFILEGGTLYYDRLKSGAMRESFTEGAAEDKTRGFTYGDKNVRADAGVSFGIVPMPGIIDTEIRTKTPEGSLREAIINFDFKFNGNSNSVKLRKGLVCVGAKNNTSYTFSIAEDITVTSPIDEGSNIILNYQSH